MLVHIFDTNLGPQFVFEDTTTGVVTTFNRECWHDGVPMLCTVDSVDQNLFPGEVIASSSTKSARRPQLRIRMTNHSLFESRMKGNKVCSYVSQPNDPDQFAWLVIYDNQGSMSYGNQVFGWDGTSFWHEPVNDFLRDHISKLELDHLGIHMYGGASTGRRDVRPEWLLNYRTGEVIRHWDKRPAWAQY